jgi:hypothetical protein
VVLFESGSYFHPSSGRGGGLSARALLLRNLGGFVLSELKDGVSNVGAMLFTELIVPAFKNSGSKKLLMLTIVLT